MPFTKQPDFEPIPGYRLISPLGCGGFGEVWKCRAPGGLFKAIKFVYGNLNGLDGHSTQAHEELNAIQHIKDIRHPFLLSMDRVENNGGELMIVTELADKNLHEVLTECQGQGLPGIPREDLVRYLNEAAEVLDLMNVKQGLQHLDVKPRNLFLVSNHVKVADFGLVTSLAGAAGIKLGAVTPLYASPEVFQGQVSRASDQYSLACCYVELLTGCLPFQGQNCRQLLLQHLQAEPDLSKLPEADRPVVQRALSKDPTKRYSSCLEFVRMLQARRLENGAETDLEETLFGLTDLEAAPPAGSTDARCEALKHTPGDNKLVDTDVQRVVKGLPAMPAALAGYQLTENQGSSLLADVWKATAPDGRLRQVKFIYGFAGRAEEAVRRLQALRHPALPNLEVIQSDPGCLVLVNDYANESVRDRWQKCQAQKLPGIPRQELLGYLRTVAEVVDYLYHQHSVHHLGLNPGLLLLADGGLQIADFGLAHLFWAPAGQPFAERNPRYAAPELFERQIHRTSDQYSLAVMYQELLTGLHPFGGRSRALAGSARAKVTPKLDGLSEGDRAAIARALDTDPQERWPSCLDLFRALEKSGGNDESLPHTNDNVLGEIIVSSQQPPLPPGGGAGEDLRQFLSDFIDNAGGAVPAADPLGLPRLSEAGDELLHQFRVGLPVGAARVRVDAFRQQCQGQLTGEDEKSYAFQVVTPVNFWRQWLGRQAGVNVAVQFQRPHALSATPIDVTVSVRAVNCGKKKAAQLVQEIGADLLEGLRTFLLVNSEKRTHDRLLWPHAVEICPIQEDGSVSAPIICRGKDLSLSGMAFYLPHELPTTQVMIRLRGLGSSQQVTIPATLVRARRCADGWYDVGALFRLAARRGSRPEMCLSSKK